MTSINKNMHHKNMIRFTTIFVILLICACTLPAKAKTLNVAKMPGFDPVHATSFLQAAFDSGADKVVIPDINKPYIVTPLELRSNQTIVFQPGVVILAKKGAFKGVGESLFTARNVKNLTIVGAGATWRMHKKDYDNPEKYKHSEWRMGLRILGCTNVTIEGLTIEKTGGDGIYIRGSKKRNYSKNITIRNVVLFDNYRQGISVISVDGLVIENTIMRDTGGTPPAAGIDFEPNSADQRLSNIILRNCLTWGNQGHGYEMYLVNLNAKSKPISIHFYNCRSLGDERNAVGITTSNTVAKAPRGKVTFSDCLFKSSVKSGIMINKPADAFQISFNNCILDRVGSGNGKTYPIEFASAKNTVTPIGGVTFNQVKIIDSDNCQPLGYITESTLSPLQNITGTLLIADNKSIKKIKLTPERLKKWSPVRKFEVVPYVNLSNVKWLPNQMTSGSSIKLNKIKIRWGADYGLYAKKDTKVKLDVFYGKISNYSGNKMSVMVKGPDNQKVLTTSIPFEKITSIQFIAPETGLYHITAKSKRNFARIVSANCPIGIITPHDGTVFNHSKGTYYLWVPKGTKVFAIHGAGTKREGFRMVLNRPDGTVAAGLDKITKQVQITVHPTSAQTGKIWQLKLLPAADLLFEDYRITLLGIPPLLSASPDSVIKSKWTSER